MADAPILPDVYEKLMIMADRQVRLIEWIEAQDLQIMGIIEGAKKLKREV